EVEVELPEHDEVSFDFADTASVQLVGNHHRVLVEERGIAAADDVERTVKNAGGRIELAVGVHRSSKTEIRSKTRNGGQRSGDLGHRSGIEQPVGVMLCEHFAL